MPFPVVAAVAAAAGIGLQLFGANKQAKAQQKQARLISAAAAKAAKQQNEIIEGTIMPLIEKQGIAQEKASEQSREAEKLRAKQMELDASRTKRDILRNAIMARSVSLTRANAQGAGGMGRESSSLFGSFSQITSEKTRQERGVNQNVEIGRGIFAANLSMSEFISEANRYGTEINLAERKLQTIQNKSNAKLQGLSAQPVGSEGAMYSQIGSSIISNLGTIDSLGTSALFGSSQSWYTSNASNGYFYEFGANDPWTPVV